MLSSPTPQYCSRVDLSGGPEESKASKGDRQPTDGWGDESWRRIGLSASRLKGRSGYQSYIVWKIHNYLYTWFFGYKLGNSHSFGWTSADHEGIWRRVGCCEIFYLFLRPCLFTRLNSSHNEALLKTFPEKVGIVFYCHVHISGQWDKSKHARTFFSSEPYRLAPSKGFKITVMPAKTFLGYECHVQSRFL
jgi:hypothetical protein